MAGFFDTLFSGGAEREAADRNRQALGQYQTQGLGALQQGYTTGRADLGQAIGAYQPLANIGQQFGGANQMLLNAYGLGGPEGTAAAQSAFQAGPGYNWIRDQAEQAVNRRRAGASMSNSGNTDIDLINQISGVANQEYGNWRTGLGDLSKTGIAATGAAAQGQGQGYTNLANLAQANAQNQTGIYGNVASGTMDANRLQAAGEAAGARNLLGLGTSLLSLGAGGAGGMGGLGNSLFGGAVGATGPQQPGLFTRMFG